MPKKNKDEAFKTPSTSPKNYDSDHKKHIIKMKIKEDELRKRNPRLEEKIKRLEKERNRSSSASRSSQTVPIYSAQDEAINKFIADRGTSMISIQRERKYPRNEDGSYPMTESIHDDLKP